MAAQSGIPADMPAFPLPAHDLHLRELLAAEVHQHLSWPHADIDGKLTALAGALARGDDAISPWAPANPEII